MAMAGETVTCRHPGRKQAFLELITAVEGELSGFVRHRVGSVHATQDIVQKTYLRAWGNAKFDPAQVHARAWLFKTARRLIIDWLEAEKSNSISLDELSARVTQDGSRGSRVRSPAGRHAHDPLAAFIEEEKCRNLDAALARLSDENREVLERYYLRQEGTQAEIAEAMGLSVAAFNSRLNRARTELKRAILILRTRGGWNGHGPF
jgi:RNA polymerase sigma-70 factor (ECF subfamily)